MDSLLANYASSDEEQEEEQQQQQQQYHTASPANSSQPSSSPSKVSPLFDSLSRPKSSSLFSSLPQPKQSNLPIDEDDKQPHPSSKTASVSKSSIFSSLPQLGQPQFSDIPIGLDDEQEEDLKPSSRPKSSSIFLSLPQPKSQNPQQTTSTPPSMGSIPKKVIQFKPPIKPPLTKPNNFDEDDDDEDDEEKERKKRRLAETLAQNSSVKSFLSSIPAPRMSATLGILPSSGSGRRSIIDTEAPTSNSAGSGAHNELGTGQNVVNYAYQESSDNQNAVNYAHNEIAVDQSAAYDGSYGSGIDQYWANSANYGDYGNCDQTVGVSGGASSYGSYENYGSYMSYDNQYGHDWGDGSGATTVPQAVGVVESAVKVLGKRGKNEIPTKIVEVKQDELMKNRPREDQVKLTGIAFGPSYKPVSTQGKPTKLHKRKHQIGSLFYDMKQKEMELAERRAKGFLTKAETQAKYGW